MGVEADCVKVMMPLIGEVWLMSDDDALDIDNDDKNEKRLGCKPAKKGCYEQKPAGGNHDHAFERGGLLMNPLNGEV